MIFLKYYINFSDVSLIDYPGDSRNYKILMDNNYKNEDIFHEIRCYLRGNSYHITYADYFEYMIDKNIAFELSLITIDPKLSNRVVIINDSI